MIIFLFIIVNDGNTSESQDLWAIIKPKDITKSSQDLTKITQPVTH